MKKLTSSFFLIFLFLSFNSCVKPNPETVLRIKLGEPVKNQVSKCLANGLLKERNNDNKKQYYIEYGSNLLGDVYISSYNSSSEPCVRSVVIQFLNPDLDSKYKLEDPSLYSFPYYSLSSSQKDELQELFIQKYGKPDKEYNDIYTWNKKDLIIILRIDKVRFSLFSAWVMYKYPEDIEKEIINEDIQNNKNI